MTVSVKDGMVVSIAYTLRLPTGELVDASPEDEPLEYLHGADNIVPGLEKGLAGLEVGAKTNVTVGAADGYGEYDPEYVEEVDRADLPKELPITLGMTIAVTDDEGWIEEAIVREISKNKVKLDFNHPLAGQTLVFDVEVVGIREATDEELDHGHPHGLMDDEDDFYDEDDFDEDDDDFDYEEDEDEEDTDKPRRL